MGMQNLLNRKVSLASPVMVSQLQAFVLIYHTRCALSYRLCLRANGFGCPQNSHSTIATMRTPCLSWWYCSSHLPWDPGIVHNNSPLITCLAPSGTTIPTNREGTSNSTLALALFLYVLQPKHVALSPITTYHVVHPIEGTIFFMDFWASEASWAKNSEGIHT